MATKLNFFIHNLAQMKFTGSDARPTLSFAPRTHTLKASGRIRDVFLCRHEKIFNPSKGYVSGAVGDQSRGGAAHRRAALREAWSLALGLCRRRRNVRDQPNPAAAFTSSWLGWEW